MTPAQTEVRIRELVADGRRMFRHSPLSDAELERLAASSIDATAGDGLTCSRCYLPVNSERQLCKARTPASPFCWTEQLQKGELEIQPGLRLRPGDNYPSLKHLEDPYAE